MKVRKPILLMILCVLMFSSLVSAQVKSVPVDVPGTDIQLFLLRYEGSTPPYAQLEAIWNGLSDVFLAWVEAGQQPGALSAEDVSVGEGPNGDPAVFLQDTLVIEVDAFHSQVNRATQQQLAEIWAANLREGVKVFVSTNVAHR